MKKFREKHILRMEIGGTGYAGSSGEKLNATKFSATAWV